MTDLEKQMLMLLVIYKTIAEHRQKVSYENVTKTLDNVWYEELKDPCPLTEPDKVTILKNVCKYLRI